MGMLDGLRVLDFSMNAAGPVGAALMADYGATVIKIERPKTGDDGRTFGPFIDGQSIAFAWLNSGKQSVTVNLSDPEGVAFVKRLIKDADVIIESFRPGVMKKLGLGYEHAAAIKPDIIYGSLSAFGQEGPYAARPGYDIIAQAMSGIMATTGDPEGPPMITGIALGDLVGALNLFASVMTALYYRNVTGIGQHVDVSLVRGLMWMNGSLNSINTNVPPKRAGNHHSVLSPYGVHNGKNGQSIVVAAVGKRVWEALCDVMGHPELKNDPRFEAISSRVTNRAELTSIIEGWLKTFDDIGDAVALLQKAGVPACKVYQFDDVCSDPHYLGQGWLTEVPVPDGVTSRKTLLLRAPNAQFPAAPGVVGRAPSLGQDNHSVMAACGYSQEEIERLQQKWASK